jgi:CRISPR-associated protein Cas5t
MFCLEIKAPFATFRHFTAGSFRPTAGFITPSAAYGLLLNLAGVEMRQDDGKSPMTVIKSGLPKCRIALGSPDDGRGKAAIPNRQTIYQQLHNYPIGKGGTKEEKEKIKKSMERSKDNKYNIVPVRRAFLSDVRAFIAIDGDKNFIAQIEAGLSGETPHRYGLPFLGDNSFMPDVICPIRDPTAFWWMRVREGGLHENVSRLTISIDRTDMTQTRSDLFAPSGPATNADNIPDSAWVEVGY